MTTEQLTEATGCYARFCRLVKLPTQTLEQEAEMYAVADTLIRLGVGIEKFISE